MDNLQIVKLTADNFKRLKAVVIEPHSDVVKICGRNEAGKSSTLDAIWAALGGKDASPDKPIRDGEKTASVTLDLGDLIVTRKWTEKGNYLEVTDAEGAPFASPQKVLDKLYGKFTFDPAAFLAEKDQRAALLHVVDLAPDWKAFKAASGMAVAVPLEIRDPLRYIGDVRKTVYEKRRDMNRDAKAAESRVDVAREQVPDGIDLDAEPPNVNALLDERKAAEQAHKAHEGLRRELAGVQGERERTELNIEKWKEQIEDIKRNLVNAEALLNEINENITAEQGFIEQSAAALPDLDAIDVRIAEVSELQKSFAAVKNLKAVESEYKAAQDAAAAVDSKLTAIDNFTAALLDGVQMPVAGLGITDDGITLNDIPFSQCSHAQRLKTAVAIGMAANPKLRILRISDGEKFDSASWAIIEEMAAENNFQVWVEQMDESGQVGVYIEDGAVVKNNYEGEAK